MPSNIAANIRAIYCDDELCNMEKDIRYASAIDALGDLRRALHLRVYISKLKIKNVTGQRGNTRSRNMQETIETRVSAAANKYRQARRAFISLAGDEEGSRLKELKPQDVKGLGERAVEERERREVEATRQRVRGDREAEAVEEQEDERSAARNPQGSTPATSGESRRHISWLWYQGGLEIQDGALSQEMNEGTSDLLFVLQPQPNLLVRRRGAGGVVEIKGKSAAVGGGDQATESRDGTYVAIVLLDGNMVGRTDGENGRGWRERWTSSGCRVAGGLVGVCE